MFKNILQMLALLTFISMITQSFAASHSLIFESVVSPPGATLRSLMRTLPSSRLAATPLHNKPIFLPKKIPSACLGSRLFSVSPLATNPISSDSSNSRNSFHTSDCPKLANGPKGITIESNKKTIRILSIDGGGVRGIIPAQILTRLEDKLGKPIATHFDFMAGTSTGGLITLGLNVPESSADKSPKYKALELVNLYEQRGKEIFPKKSFGVLAGIFAPKYDSAPLQEVLKDYFGEHKMAESITTVFVTSYDMHRDRYKFFTNYDIYNTHKPSRSWESDRYIDDSSDDPFKNYFMRDVAYATSAAPTYFKPAEIFDHPILKKIHSCIDGGVVANNPTVAALFTATYIFPACCHRYVILSLGTGEKEDEALGEYEEKVKNDEGLQWIGLQWPWPLKKGPPIIIDLLMDASSQIVHEQMKEFSRRSEMIDIDYIRIQPKLKRTQMKMDNTSCKNLTSLKLCADEQYNSYLDQSVIKDPKELRMLNNLFGTKG